METRTRRRPRAEVRAALIDAAERRFSAQGFHATSLDQIAAEAGFTKGAVYSNFASKEDLFFAVYERRAARGIEHAAALVHEHGPAGGLEALAAETASRRGRDDGWLATFYEFWAHVVRHPEHRERFARTHAQTAEPLVAALDAFVAEHGVALPVDARRMTTAMNAMQLGLTLERFVQPDVVDAELGPQMVRVTLGHLKEGRT
jgi:AcrR family transcriptional regulator